MLSNEDIFLLIRLKMILWGYYCEIDKKKDTDQLKEIIKELNDGVILLIQKVQGGQV